VPLVTVAAALAVPVLPAQATCQPAGPDAFVTNRHDSTVSVINNCAQVIATHLVPGATGVAVSPGGATYYVTSATNAGLWVVDTATERNLAIIVPISTPTGVAVRPDGSIVYVADGPSDTVSVVSTATNMVTDTIPLGRDASGIAVSPDGSAVYVTSSKSDSVSVISTNTDMVTATTPVGAPATGVAVSPDGSVAYVMSDDGTVTTIDTTDNQPLGAFTGAGGGFSAGLNDMAVSPDGGTLYADANRSNALTIDDTSLYANVGSIPVGSDPDGVAVIPDGVFGYVSNALGNSVSKFNSTSESVVNTIQVGNGPLDVATVPPKLARLGGIWLHGLFCAAVGSCIAVGTQAAATGTAGLALVRSGGRWRRTEPLGLPGTTGDTVYQVACRSRSDCVAVGGANERPAAGGPSRSVPLAGVWNGATWAASQPPLPAGAQGAVLRDVSCGPSDGCLAVGYYLNSAGTVVPLSERWTGSAWQLLTTPSVAGARAGRLLSVSCRGSRCDAVGAFESSSSRWSPLAEAWTVNGWRLTRMQMIPGHPAFAVAQGISCAAQARCVAVGDARLSGRTVPFAEQLSGGRWHLLPRPARAPADGELGSVSCPAVNRCVATGSAASHGTQAPLAEAWNGTSWRVLTVPGPASATLSVLSHVWCTSPASCLAVGNDGMKTLAERWNGRSWTVLPAPL
jgi:YVTN family beta-propeller protein